MVMMVDFIDSCTARYYGPVTQEGIDFAVKAATARVLTLNLEVLSDASDDRWLLEENGFRISGSVTAGNPTRTLGLYRRPIRDAGDGQAAGVPEWL